MMERDEGPACPSGAGHMSLPLYASAPMPSSVNHAVCRRSSTRNPPEVSNCYVAGWRWVANVDVVLAGVEGKGLAIVEWWLRVVLMVGGW